MDEKKTCIKIQRYNPDTDTGPIYQAYYVPVTEEKMNLLQALEYIHQEIDDTLAFRRYCCGLQFCNSCMMLVNGKPDHACLTLLVPGSELIVSPLANRRVLRDLIVEGKDSKYTTA